MTTGAFRRVMAEAPSVDGLLDELSRSDPEDRETIRTLSARIRRTLEGTAVPDGVAAAVTGAFARFGGRVAWAVRSSATAEDLPTASFAGQQDTYLNVVGPAAVLRHVSRCWASLFTERAVTYRRRNGIDDRTVQMAVVVTRFAGGAGQNGPGSGTGAACCAQEDLPDRRGGLVVPGHPQPFSGASLCRCSGSVQHYGGDVKVNDAVPAGWSVLTFKVLRTSGWHPGRNVSSARTEQAFRESGGFEMHDAARQFLEEYEGVKNDRWSPGPIMPQSPFRLDPFVATDRRDLFASLSREAGVPLYPVGLADGGDSFLGMAPDGSVHVGLDHVEWLADSGHEALEKLVVERRTDAPLPFVKTPEDDLLIFPHHPEHDASLEIGTRWSAEADFWLRRAGWFPGRSVPTAEWERVLRENDEDFVIHDAALCFLAEFGGLEFDIQGPGRTMARSPFRLDPTHAKWDYEIFEVLSEEAGVYLYPLGDASDRNTYLGMSADGAVYVGMDEPTLLADNGDKALDKLLKGVR